MRSLLFLCGMNLQRLDCDVLILLSSFRCGGPVRA